MRLSRILIFTAINLRGVLTQLSYVILVQAMNSHDVGRDRGGVAEALAALTMPTLILGIPSDRLFMLEGQDRIAQCVPGSLDGQRATRIDSPFGHDSFLIEFELVGEQLERLLTTST